MPDALFSLAATTAAQHNPDAPLLFEWTLPASGKQGPASLRITCATCGGHLFLTYSAISAERAARQAAHDEVNYALELGAKHERFHGPRIAEGPCPALPAIRAFCEELRGERGASWRHHVPGIGIVGLEDYRLVGAAVPVEHLMVVTENPTDYPGLFVARAWTQTAKQLRHATTVETAPTLAGVREKVPPYYEEVLPLNPGQDPKIVAVWRIPAGKAKLKAALELLASTAASVAPEDLDLWREMLGRGDAALRRGQGEEVEAARAAVDAMMQRVVGLPTTRA